jgi:hypothetical protein
MKYMNTNNNGNDKYLKNNYVLITEFDEEDWNHLLIQDLMDDTEDGKEFLRAN